MTQRHLALIGYGAIAADLIPILYDQPEGGPERLSLLVRQVRLAETQKAVSAQLGTKKVRLEVCSELDNLLAAQPDLVVEAAGHQAVASYGAEILKQGCDFLIASVGALADADLLQQLTKAARDGGAQLIVPAGAIGGIDALGAARLSGLVSVRYIGRKPPLAWAGTAAGSAAELAGLTEAQQIFSGSAREAARQFPKNANVAATLALAGMGMEETRVSLIADPSVSENSHEFEVESAALSFSVKLVGNPSPANPKTSRSTVFSIARAVLAREQAMVI